VKRFITIAALLAAQPAFAKEPVTNATVYDHTKVIYTQVPVNEVVCYDVEVPIYKEVKQQGDAAGGALLGMLLGGAIGKGVSGDDKGAAAGAVIGGLIGADKGAKPKPSQQIVGYEVVERCKNRTSYNEEKKEVYSHSTISFYLDGKRYVLSFQK